VENPQLTINYAYLHQYNIDQPRGFQEIMDGIAYHSLSATYDTVNQIYECRNDDVRSKITANEALQCHNLLKSTCQKIEDRICPCYSMSQLAKAEIRIRKGADVIDAARSCVIPTKEFDKYGLYQISDFNSNGLPCDDCTTIMFAVQNENACFDGTDIVRMINVGQRMHCFNMMQNACSSMEPLLSDVTLPILPECHDEIEYRVDLREDRDCQWVGEDLKKRCRRSDSSTGKRVFEHCRKTCGYCACKDDENFLLNGESGNNCDWVGQDPVTRCALDESVRNSCVATCSTKCCKNSEKFKLWGIPSLTCAWVSGKVGKVSQSLKGSKAPASRSNHVLCGLKSFSANCPESCGMCPATIDV
jgi:hypothetical protein